MVEDIGLASDPSSSRDRPRRQSGCGPPSPPGWHRSCRHRTPPKAATLPRRRAPARPRTARSACSGPAWWPSRRRSQRVIAVSFTRPVPRKQRRSRNRTVELSCATRLRRSARRRGRRRSGSSDRLEDCGPTWSATSARSRPTARASTWRPAAARDVVDQQVADINRELVAARGDLAQRQASVAFAHELGAHGRGHEGSPEVMNSTVITDLRRQEGELLRSEAELRLHLRREAPAAAAGARAAGGSRGQDQPGGGPIVAGLESQATTAQARVAALQQQLDGVLGTRTRNREAELQLGELEPRPPLASASTSCSCSNPRKRKRRRRSSCRAGASCPARPSLTAPAHRA